MSMSLLSWAAERILRLGAKALRTISKGIQNCFDRLNDSTLAIKKITHLVYIGSANWIRKPQYNGPISDT
jgi:hypothetical protein